MNKTKLNYTMQLVKNRETHQNQTEMNKQKINKIENKQLNSYELYTLHYPSVEQKFNVDM